VITGFFVIASVVTAEPPIMQKPLEMKERPAQQPTMQKPPGMQEMQKPPAKPLPVKCPDIAITDVEVKLVSTELGKPGVEFPTDKVAIYFKINNIGTIETPSKFDVYVYRKNERICGMTIGTIQPQESTGPYSCRDSFPHGVYTFYKIVANTTFTQCTKDNNKKSVPGVRLILRLKFGKMMA
jgi:hypothetical protein